MAERTQRVAVTLSSGHGSFVVYGDYTSDKVCKDDLEKGEVFYDLVQNSSGEITTLVKRAYRCRIGSIITPRKIEFEKQLDIVNIEFFELKENRLEQDPVVKYDYSVLPPTKEDCYDKPYGDGSNSMLSEILADKDMQNIRESLYDHYDYAAYEIA